MRIMIGIPPTGDDFYQREKIINQLIRALQVEQAVFIDLEGFDHPKFWIKSLMNELCDLNDKAWLQTVKKLPDLIPHIKSDILEISETSWEDKADNLLKSLQALDTPIWFLLDEFPIMIDNIANRHGKEEAAAALHWLRRVRQQHSHCPVRFLLTGSIGLDSVLRRHGIRGVANDLRREELLPLLPDEALQLARDNQIVLDELSAQQYINRLGPAVWPYFIQLFIAELQDHSDQSQQPADMDGIYRTVSLGKRNQYSDNMWERLREIFNDTEAMAARQILKIIASHESGVALETLRSQVLQLEEGDFSNVLEVLQHDGYLIEDDAGHIYFFSHLLRDYWRHKGRV